MPNEFKQIDFNEEMLSYDDIQKTVNKARAIVVNKETGKVLFVRYAGVYMFPGGSFKDDENPIESLKRELLEEAGIEISSNQTTPFLLINSFDKNYHDRKAGIINRLTRTFVFEVETDQEIDPTKMTLTDSEKASNFTISYVNLADIEHLVETNITDNKKRKQFDREVLAILSEYEMFKDKQAISKTKIKTL